MARERRSKKDVIIGKIAVIEEKIAAYQQKIEDLSAEKDDLQDQLDKITSAEKKAAEEAQMKEVLKLIKAKNLSVEELREMVQNR